MSKGAHKKKKVSKGIKPASVQWFVLPADGSSEGSNLPVWGQEAILPETHWIGFVRPSESRHVSALQKLVKDRQESLLIFTGKRSIWKEVLSDLLSGTPMGVRQASALVLSKAALTRAEHIIPEKNLDSLAKTLYGEAQIPTVILESPALKEVSGSTFTFALGPGWGKKQLSPSKAGNAFAYRMTFWALALIMVIAMPWMSRTSGITGDEFTQHEFSDLVINYFTDGDTAALYQPKTLMHFYGSSFDTFSNVVIRTLNLENIYESRHFINSLFGWLAILFAGLLAMRLSDWRSGIIALLFVFFTPRFLGHSFNNPKDVPFALGYIMSLYYTIKLFKTYPVMPKRTLFMLALSLAIGMSVRVGGLLSFAYVFVMLGFTHIGLYGLPSIFKDADKRKWLIGGGITAALGCVLAWVLGILPWPYGLHAPIDNPLNALKEFSNYNLNLRQLFEGKNVMSQEFPKYYLLKYLWLTTPLIVLVGICLLLVFSLLKQNMKNWNAPMLMLAFAVIFPLSYIYFKGSSVYGGLRHILFTFPPLAILGAMGFQWFLEYFSSKKWALPTAGVVLAAGLSLPAMHTVKNHPYQYIYYNELSGGMDKVYGNYELDYYHASHKEASEWLIDYLNKNKAWGSKEKPIRIVSNFTKATRYYFRNEPIDQKEIEYSRYYEKNQNNWDYFIMNNTYINAFHVKNGLYPPKGTIHTIDLNGKPICAIIKRPSYDDVQGFDLYKKGQYAEAISKFETYLQVDPTESSVLNALANCYMMLGQNDKAAQYAQQAVQYYPEYTEALFTIGRIQMNQGQMQNAIMTFDNVLKDSPSSYGAWYLKAYAQFLLKDYNNALQSLEQCLNYNQGFKDAYLLGASIYEAQGNAQQAQRLREIAAQIK